ncbi:hypothetical protein [Terracoccus luteus]|uniref:hypothetical protein n=1 Tax=Terracoccus luteus TaxID=53356 RepID=UPI0011C43C7F|nr:hypothetical protein [Terracoccus luteus]
MSDSLMKAAEVTFPALGPGSGVTPAVAASEAGRSPYSATERKQRLRVRAGDRELTLEVVHQAREAKASSGEISNTDPREFSEDVAGQQQRIATEAILGAKGSKFIVAVIINGHDDLH